ncbi:MAG TPA: hypothetical protein VHF24_13725 [Acidimicrobiales bacterium]|nr:hypothetical protein [Acidimicrobiales bacterium]
MRRWLVTVVAVLAVVVGCGSDDEEPARPLDAAAPPGFTVVQDETIGFAVSVPESWRQLPTEIGSFDGVAEGLRRDNERMGPPLTQLKGAVREGARLAVVDPATGSTANLIVLPSDSDLDDMASGAAIRLRQTGATGLTQEKTTLDGVPAIRQRFRVQYPGTGGSVELQESQYYVVRRGRAFILTLVGQSPDLDRIATSLQLA